VLLIFAFVLLTAPLPAYRKPFKPLKSDCLIVRSIQYAGEEHPATAKRVVTVAIDDLPLRNEAAVHKFKLLAGPRWSIRPPADSGVSGLSAWGNGFVKIACEDFPNPEQNLKWISDRLDSLIKEANVRRFLSLPLLFVLPPLSHRLSTKHSGTFPWIFAICTPRQEKRRKESIFADGCSTAPRYVTSLKSGYLNLAQIRHNTVFCRPLSIHVRIISYSQIPFSQRGQRLSIVAQFPKRRLLGSPNPFEFLSSLLPSWLVISFVPQSFKLVLMNIPFRILLTSLSASRVKQRARVLNSLCFQRYFSPLFESQTLIDFV
jgi:hypothetical protein